MAKKGRKVITTREEIEDDDAPDNTAVAAPGDELPQDDPLDALLSEISGKADVTLNIYKLDPDNSRSRKWCMNMELDEETGLDTGSLMQTLQNKYKGGHFEVIVRGDAGVMLRRRRFEVMEPEAPTQAPANELAAAINAAMQPMMAALARVAARPQFDINRIIGMASQAAPALMALKQLFGPNNPQPSGGMDFDKFLEFKAKMDALGFGDHEPSPSMQMLTMFKELGKPLLDAVQQAQQNRVQNPNPAMRPPSLVPAMSMPVMPAAPGVAARQVDPATMLMSSLKPYVPFVVQFAQGGLAPEVAAEKLIDAIPEAMVDPLCDAIENGTLLPMLLAIPELAPYGIWLQSVLTSTLDQLSVDSGEPEPDDTDVPVGNANPENPAH